MEHSFTIKTCVIFLTGTRVPRGWNGIGSKVMIKLLFCATVIYQWVVLSDLRQILLAITLISLTWFTIYKQSSAIRTLVMAAKLVKLLLCTPVVVHHCLPMFTSVNTCLLVYSVERERERRAWKEYFKNVEIHELPEISLLVEI